MLRKSAIWFRILLILGVFFFAQQVWAVIGNIEFTDSGGNPIAGATITLTAPDGTETEGETDITGQFSAEEGSYTVVIRYDSQVHRTSITVRGGQMVRVEVPTGVPSTAPPPVTPGSKAVFIADVESVDDLTRTSSTETLRATFTDSSGNSTSFEETNTADQELLDQTNSEIDQGLDINTVGGEFTFGRGSGSYYGSRAFGMRDLAWQSSFADQGGYSGRSGSRRVFYPFVSVMLGRADVELKFVLAADPSMSQTFDGDGFIFGIGGGAVFFLCNDCNWYGGGSYKYRRISNFDMTLTPPFPVIGGVLTDSAFEFDFDSHVIQGIVGYNLNNVAPYGGVRYHQRTVRLDGDINADFSQSFPGFTVTSSLTFSEELEENTTEGVAGVDFRFGHFVAGVESSFNSNNYSVDFHAGFGF